MNLQFQKPLFTIQNTEPIVSVNLCIYIILLWMVDPKIWRPWDRQNPSESGVKHYYNKSKSIVHSKSDKGSMCLVYILPNLPYERRLLLIIFWKAACLSVTPYLVQLTSSLEACSWKNGDLVFQCLSFFSIVWWVRRRSGEWRSTTNIQYSRHVWG